MHLAVIGLDLGDDGVGLGLRQIPGIAGAVGHPQHIQVAVVVAAHCQPRRRSRLAHRLGVVSCKATRRELRHYPRLPSIVLLCPLAI
jgi:hypothetical protein